MSETAPEGPYVYQPFGMQDGADRWKRGRIYGVGGVSFYAEIKGLTKAEAESIVRTLKLDRAASAPIPVERGHFCPSCGGDLADPPASTSCVFKIHGDGKS